ncbi:MAG: GtrA family protein, partial [Sphingomonas sp.]
VALQAGGMMIGLVSALSYSAGIAAHWLISTRFVFADDVRALGAERRGQQMLFLISALVGLSLTTVIVTLAVALGLDARPAKLVAVGVSFQATYLLRAKVVFA